MKTIISTLTLSMLLLTACSHSNKPTEIVQSCYEGIDIDKEAPEQKGFSQLSLSIKGKEVKGHLEIHPFDDYSCVGSLAGTIKNNTIQAQYDYHESGLKETSFLTITLKKNEASIAEDKQNKVVSLPLIVDKINCSR